MSKPIDITPANFEQEVLKSTLPVLVDFWAPWCGPCQMLSPILDELADELKNKIKIVKISLADETNQDLAEKYQVQGLPNLKLFKNGQVIKDFGGLKEKNDLKNVLTAEV